MLIIRYYFLSFVFLFILGINDIFFAGCFFFSFFLRGGLLRVGLRLPLLLLFFSGMLIDLFRQLVSGLGEILLGLFDPLYVLVFNRGLEVVKLSLNIRALSLVYLVAEFLKRFFGAVG